MPFARLEGGVLVRTEALEPDVELSPSEAVLWRCLIEHGGAATRGELRGAVESVGFSEGTLAQQLAFSPIIRRVGPSVYSLSSEPATRAGIAAALARRSPTEQRTRTNY